MTTRLALLTVAALALAVPGLARDDPPGKAAERWQTEHKADAHGAQPHAAAAHGDGHSEVVVPPAPAVSYRGCAAFVETGYRGRRTDVAADSAIEWLGRAGDNRISSVACASGCRLLAYEHINFGGARRSFGGATADVGAAWNDRISAVRAICAGDAPLIHQGH